MDLDRLARLQFLGGRQVFDFGDQRQFAAVDQFRNSFDQCGFDDAVRNRIDSQHARTFGPFDNLAGSSQLDRALAGAIDVAQFLFGVDHLTAGGKVRAMHGIVGDQLIVFDLGIF